MKYKSNNNKSQASNASDTPDVAGTDDNIQLQNEPRQSWPQRVDLSMQLAYNITGGLSNTEWPSPSSTKLPDDRITASLESSANVTDALVPAAATQVPNGAANLAINGAIAQSLYNATGAKIKIGIISNSLNADIGGNSDPADTAAAAGYIPANPDGTSAIVNLSPTAAGTDEGLAMAELIDETAPGAQLYFASGGSNLTTFSAAVAELQSEGCQIIVDDLYSPALEPFFGQTDPLDAAITNYINDEGNYFTAAGNNGNNYYSGVFQPFDDSLNGIGDVQANDFGAGDEDPYESITVPIGSTVTIDLQWNQPFAKPGGSQYTLDLALFDSSGKLLMNGNTAAVGGCPVEQIVYTNPNSFETSFDIAVYEGSGNIVSPADYKIIFSGLGIGSTNVVASNGGGGGDLYGHTALSGVNVVGAANVTNTTSIDAYSEAGDVSFVAPDGSATSVPGFDPFTGTSAAAPVAAAVAALMLQKNPALTDAQVTEYLTESGIAMVAPNTGGGLIQADTALGLATGNFLVESELELDEAINAIGLDSEHQNQSYTITLENSLTLASVLPLLTLSNLSTLDIEGRNYTIDLGGLSSFFSDGEVLIDNATINNAGALDSNSLLELINSSLSVTALPGTGIIYIGNTSTLSVSGTIASGAEISFDGTNSTLRIDDPQQDYGTISAFLSGDTIDLAGVGTVMGGTLSAANVLTLPESGGGSVTVNLDPTKDYSGYSFLFAPDGAGGTDISNAVAGAFTGPNQLILALTPPGGVSTFQASDTLDLLNVGPPSTYESADYSGFKSGYYTGTTAVSLLITSDGAHGTDITAYKNNQAIAFTGTSEILIITAFENFTGQVDDIQQGDVIIFADENYIGAISSGNKLGNIQLDPTEGFSQFGLLYSQSGIEGEAVQFAPAASASNSQTVVSTNGVSYAAVNLPTSVQFSPIRTNAFYDQSVEVSLGYAGGDPSKIAITTSGYQYSDGSPVGGNFYVGPGAGTVTAMVAIPDTDYYADASIVPASFSIHVTVSDDANPAYPTNPTSVTIPGIVPAYNPALAKFAIGGTTISTYDLGVFHLGGTASVDIVITNSNTGALADTLSSSIGSIGEFTALNALTNIASGQSGTVAVNFTAEAEGVTTVGSPLFNLTSHDSVLPDVGAESASLELTAEVYEYAQPTLVKVQSYFGPSGGQLTQTGVDAWSLDFGTIVATGSPDFSNAGIDVNNAASAALSDTLGGSFSSSGSGFIATIGTSFTGYSDLLGSFTPDLTKLGSHTLTVIYYPTSVDSAGTTALPDITLTVTDNVLCFRAGSRIATPLGEVPIERLACGDTVLTASGQVRSIVWIGHRHVNCNRHPKPEKVWPVRVAAGAFGDNLPHRDLWLSPDHAVFVQGMLIPIKHLTNGTSIAQVSADQVTYYHVELRQHDVLLADGLPAESYLDIGDRSNFDNGDKVMRLFPDFSTRTADIAMLWETKGCAPLVIYGAKLEAARAFVNAQACARQPESAAA